jgi:hypothetical protein
MGGGVLLTPLLLYRGPLGGVHLREVEAAAADPVLRIAAPSLEELHHEAREA